MVASRAHHLSAHQLQRETRGSEFCVFLSSASTLTVTRNSEPHRRASLLLRRLRPWFLETKSLPPLPLPSLLLQQPRTMVPTVERMNSLIFLHRPPSCLRLHWVASEASKRVVEIVRERVRFLVRTKIQRGLQSLLTLSSAPARFPVLGPHVIATTGPTHSSLEPPVLPRCHHIFTLLPTLENLVFESTSR